MPNIIVRTNARLGEENKKEMLVNIAKWTAYIMKKPVSDVMVMYSYNDFIMAETFEPAAFIDFNCVTGFDTEVGKELCIGINKILSDIVEIESSRIYIKFFEVSNIHAWRFIDNMPVCADYLKDSEVK